MKFAEHLNAHITPEWRKQYISYEEMKQQLYKIVNTLQVIGPVYNTAGDCLLENGTVNVSGCDDSHFSRQLNNFEESFFRFCDLELNKIDSFFSEKLAEATRKFASLTNEVKIVFEQSVAKKSKGVPEKRLREAKLAFSEFYLNIVLLQNYQQLNSTGFRKIFKKHDKLLHLESGMKWYQAKIEQAKFVLKQSEIDNLIKNVENFVTMELEDGNRQRAMKRLRVPPLGEHQLPWITFKVGFFCGAFMILLACIVLTLLQRNRPTIIELNDAIQYFRMPFFLILFLTLIAFNLYGWRSAGVNHVLIFELEPRKHLNEQNFMEIGSVWAVIWAVCVLLYLNSSNLNIALHFGPIVLLALMSIFLVNPLKLFYSQSRFWLCSITARIFSAPLVSVRFADFWLADQFCSLTVLFLDFHYLLVQLIGSSGQQQQDKTVFFATHQIVGCLPAWFRFWQCIRRFRDSNEFFPHFANALKYATTFLVAISFYYYRVNGNNFVLFYMWLLASVLNSIYSYYWDIKMDWGLFEFTKNNENLFLREEIVYSANFYYFAIVEDFLLRFSWILKAVNEQKGFASDLHLKTVLYFLEIVRRFIWNFFRLENEHLNNCGQFRAVRDISIVPIDLDNDEKKMLKMMDDPDGVTNRKNNRVLWLRTGSAPTALPLPPA